MVKHGLLTLGNLEIARDWGYAGDFVRAMWLMLQQDQAHDFVIGTGKLHTLKELCHIAYSYINKDWRRCVISDPLLMRPSEPSTACANTYKAQNLLNWHVELEFHTMIEHMVQAQIEYLASNQGRQA